MINDGYKPSKEFVLIAMWVHLFPSRTQKLSTSAPTILGGRLPGKIGNANISPDRKAGAFFCLPVFTGHLRRVCHGLMRTRSEYFLSLSRLRRQPPRLREPWAVYDGGFIVTEYAPTERSGLLCCQAFLLFFVNK